MSCGGTGPSVSCWPFFTKSPLKTMMCLFSGTRCSSSAPVSASRDDDLALAADGAADLDDAVDLGDLGGVFRTARFEELGHTRQTAGDVLGLGDLARRLGEQLAGLHFLAFAARRRARRRESSSWRASPSSSRR